MYSFKHWQKRNFWNFVRVGGLEECWTWKGGHNKGGYAQFCLNSKSVHSHRLSYFLTHGEIPEGHVIRHKCDNRSCCNPTHLSSGTSKDNVYDMISRNRHPHGDTCGMSKVTDEQALVIKRSTLSRKELAKEYGVSIVTIKRIQLGYNRKHLSESV